MITFIFLFAQRIFNTKFWVSIAVYLIVTACSGYLNGFFAGLMTFIMGLPILAVVTCIIAVQALSQLKSEVVAIGQTVSLDAIKDPKQRGDIISATCKVIGCDDHNPLVANYVLDVLLSSKEKATKHSETFKKDAVKE
jgi:hypothetical protein